MENNLCRISFLSILSSPTFYHVLSSPHNSILGNDASHLFFLSLPLWILCFTKN
ncbi:hypothetical protein PROPEN_01461 [Proteus penneri ATCC 35198]|nr:hypothetical protein PROPEN_01461 [Proteus penneri ATCC 35198]